MGFTVHVQVVADEHVVKQHEREELLLKYDAELLITRCGCGECNNLVETYYYSVHSRQHVPLHSRLEELARQDMLRMYLCSPETGQMEYEQVEVY